MSQGQTEAFDLIHKCRFIWENLTIPKPKLGSDSRGLLTFMANGSEMLALPSTADAGRSSDASLVIRDELEKHEYARENFRAIGPTVDAGGQLIEFSTIDKTRTDSFFQERFRKALAQENNAFPVFLGRNVRPVRMQGMTLDQWVNEILRKKYSKFDIEQEYPETLDEALGSPLTASFFDTDKLNEMYLDIMKPIKHELSDRYKGIVKIYKEPQAGRRYCVFCDPSDGKDDPHATIVIDSQTGEEVAESHGKTPADLCAVIYDSLVRLYNDSYSTFEVTGFSGGKMSQTVADLKTPNQHSQKKDRLGWWTSHNVKNTMLWGLEEAVRHSLIRPHSKDCINEFRDFFRPEGSEPQARVGGHDDYVMAWAGVWQLVREMPKGKIKIYSFSYKE